MLAPPSLQAIHPLGKSPVITDGDVTVAESGWIIEYLVEKYGKGRLIPAAGTQAYRDYRYFMHYAEGSLMPFLVMKLVCNKVRSDSPLLIRPIARAIAGQVSKQFLDPNVANHLAFLAGQLDKRAWFAGDAFSAADVQMSFPIEGAVSRGSGAIPPRLTEWLARIQARPAYRRAITRGGEYKIAGS
jgi:glutathione S-transferase